MGEMPLKGRGVILLKEYSQANNIIDRTGFSVSEMKDAIKIIGDVAPVRALSVGSKDGTGYRHCTGIENSITETMPHVLGSCPFGQRLRNHRHHTVRTLIADALRTKGLKVFEEVVELANAGSIRGVDILAIDRKRNVCWIIDPTVMFEIDTRQAVDPMSRRYRYSNNHLREINVIGLFVDARGNNTTFFKDCCLMFGLSSELLKP